MQKNYNIDLARANSEALGNIYSLLKLNIKSCKAKGEGNENFEKTTIGLIRKKTALPVQRTSFFFFLYISLPLFCKTTTSNVKKLPGYTLYGGNVVHVLVHFFTAAHFFFGGR